MEHDAGETKPVDLPADRPAAPEPKPGPPSLERLHARCQLIEVELAGIAQTSGLAAFGEFRIANNGVHFVFKPGLVLFRGGMLALSDALSRAAGQPDAKAVQP